MEEEQEVMVCPPLSPDHNIIESVEDHMKTKNLATRMNFLHNAVYLSLTIHGSFRMYENYISGI